MAKTQITLETEMQRRARQRASDLGVSLAEYFRRLVARDLARPETAGNVDPYFRSRKLGRLRCCKPKGFHDRRSFPIYAQETATAPIALAT